MPMRRVALHYLRAPVLENPNAGRRPPLSICSATALAAVNLAAEHSSSRNVPFIVLTNLARREHVPDLNAY